MKESGRAWGWFGAWTLAGASLVFSGVSGLSIGLLILPVAGLVIYWVARRSRLWPECTGLLAGTGLVTILVGILNRDRPELRPHTWEVAGSLLVCGAVCSFAALRTLRLSIEDPTRHAMRAGLRMLLSAGGLAALTSAQSAAAAAPVLALPLWLLARGQPLPVRFALGTLCAALVAGFERTATLAVAGGDISVLTSLPVVMGAALTLTLFLAQRRVTVDA